YSARREPSCLERRRVGPPGMVTVACHADNRNRCGWPFPFSPTSLLRAMQDSTLTRIRVPGPVSRPDLRTFEAALRNVSRAPGFCYYQTFRGIDATDVILVIMQGEREARDPLPAELKKAPPDVETVPLAGAFDLHLLRIRPAASLLRVAEGARSPGAPGEAQDRELALRAMAEPGSIRVAGGRSPRRSLTACRIDFDHEDALWHFLQSPLCRD